MAKVLMIYSRRSTWIENDSDIIRKEHELEELNWCGLKDVFRLISLVRSSDIVLSWFASTYSLFAAILCRIFNKKSFVIAGGYDTTIMPEINYGLGLSFKNKMFVGLALRLSNRIFAISEASRKDIIHNYGVVPDKVETLYLGFALDKFPKKISKKERVVVTIGPTVKSNLKRKGLEQFVKSAKYVPDVKYLLIGTPGDAQKHLEKIASNNVEFPGRISDQELSKQLSRSAVYVQVSYHEGFGCAMAEGMLFGCVPVVSDRGAIPEVVGDAGIYVELGDSLGLSEAIKQALDMNGQKAKKRIETLFPIEIRERRLLDVLR